MSLKPLLLLSAQAGGGRSTLAANLGSWLGRDAEAWVVETREPERSELALHLGRAPETLEAALKRSGPGLRHTCAVGLEACGTVLARLSGRAAFVLVDGGSFAQEDWQGLLAACGAVLLVERGDLQGYRRMQEGLRELLASHLPLSAARAVWMGSVPAQPLPPLPGLPASELPLDPKAWERLSQAGVAAIDDTASPLAKAVKQLALDLRTLTWAKGLLAPGAASGSGADPATEQAQEALLLRLADALRGELDLSQAGAQNEGFRQAWEAKVQEAAGRLLAREDAPWLDAPGRANLLRRLAQDMLGLGPLEDLLADPEVSEVMVNHPGQVYVERAGRLSLSPVRFRDERQLRTVIERIVWPLGRRIDESSPKVDARLPDGSRVNAIIPPLAVKGSCLTVRKFPDKRMSMADLQVRGAISAAAAAFLHTAVQRKRNLLVSGGTGSGKTTLLNALSASIPEGERVITIEDSAELRLQQVHVVTLEARPANLEGQGEVSIRDLVVNALRMRPDRIVVGECRGGEALDMLQAMNTGHEGSLTTLHANSTRDALQRLETLCLMSGMELPLKVVRQQVASAIDLIVQVGRLRDGSRRVLAITEVTGMEGDVLSTQDIFTFRATGTAEDGQVLGKLEPTGVAARFYHQLKADGESVDFGVFSGA